MSSLPLAVTLGDPAGVGPELALRLLASDLGTSTQSLLLFGDYDVLGRCGERLGLPLPQTVLGWEDWQASARAPATAARPTHAVVDLGTEVGASLTPGRVDAKTGAASYRYLQAAVESALAGRVSGVVTNPIHKEAWHHAGVPYPGHTEYLAERCGSDRYCMMLTAPELTVTLVTVHVGYAEVPSLLGSARIAEVIALTGEAMERLLGRPPRLGVCGLNPHAGEGGLFGTGEEERIIAPAIEAARAAGWRVAGPLPPDTAFLPRRRAETDAYICMYHDQGLIPLKTLAFDEGVNVTLGLPIVRTSVDHGTALDIAWTGQADPSSLRQAVRLASRLAGLSPSVRLN